MNGLNPAYVESVIRKAKEGKLATGQAAAKLDVNKQYVNRLKKAYAEKKGHPPSATETKARPNTRASISDIFWRSWTKAKGLWATKAIFFSPIGWCDLFWLIWSNPASRMEKVARFIEMAVSTRKRIKYLEAFRKKADE